MCRTDRWAQLFDLSKLCCKNGAAHLFQYCHPRLLGALEMKVPPIGMQCPFGSSGLQDVQSRYAMGEPMIPAPGSMPMGYALNVPGDQRKGRKPQSTNKPLAPAKSVATASRAFFKGIKKAVSEACNLALTANLAENVGGHACQVGIAVLAVGHGLTDNKNGRVSKEEEQRAARRKPQAFLLLDGQIGPSQMHKIFRSAVEGTRECSPPAEITQWHGMDQMEKWFARREAERVVFTQPIGGSRDNVGDLGEASALDLRSVPGPLNDQVGWYPADDSRPKCPIDIQQWLREECQAGLDDEDIAKLSHCFSHPDWGIKNKEFLFALSEEDLKMMMAPIREQGLKNFIVQKCKRNRQESYGFESPPSKARKIHSGGKFADRS